MATSNKGDYVPLNAVRPSKVQCTPGDHCNGDAFTKPKKRTKVSKKDLVAQLRIYGYHIGERIGDGSYSKVYYAEHQSKHDPKSFSNVPIACKIIDGRYTSSEFLEKFLPRELSIIRRLAHPHIVSIYSIVQKGPFMCFFMDFCADGDLLDCIRYRGRLSATRSRKFFSQIAGAVRYLHSMGVAHRDIKCENVLVHSRESVKLTDFGFARRMEFDQKNILVLSDTYCGSAAYAAPEVLKGVAYDPRACDMWSLGCLLYIMVTAKRPFDDQNLAVTIKKQERGEVLYPADVPVADTVKSIIQSLLQPDVNDRMTIETLMHDPWIMLT